MSRLAVAPRPCSTCPYRVDTPPGVWHPSEYAKLSLYDEGSPPLQTFLCHQGDRQFACRGWLSVHRDSVSVRLAVLRGEVDVDDPHRSVDVELYGSGTDAAAAGLAGVAEPGVAARKALERLVKRGIGR